jgi:hypothetical protein
MTSSGDIGKLLRVRLGVIHARMRSVNEDCFLGLGLRWNILDYSDYYSLFLLGLFCVSYPPSFALPVLVYHLTLGASPLIPAQPPQYDGTFFLRRSGHAIF